MTRESTSQGFLTVPFVSQVQILAVSGRSATCVSLHSLWMQRRYKIFLSPLRPSSLCAPSPPPARPFGPHQHCLLLQAVRPWPGAFRFLRSARGLSLPKIQHKNFQYFVSSETRMKAWSQLTVTEVINPYPKATNWKEKSLMTDLCCHLSTDFLLGLSQAFLGQFCPSVTLSNEWLQMIHSL